MRRLDIDISKLATTVHGLCEQQREYLNSIQLAHESLFADMIAALSEQPTVNPTRLVDQAILIHGATCSLVSLARLIETAHQNHAKKE